MPFAQALRLFEAAVIVPVMQICWTLFSIVNGGRLPSACALPVEHPIGRASRRITVDRNSTGMIYYQEYLGFNALKGCMFALGVLVSPFPLRFASADARLPSCCLQNLILQ